MELNVESGEGLALIQEGLEFPSGKISSTLTELSLEKTPYVASKVDGIKKETSFSPSFEMYTPTFLDSHVKIQLEEVPSDLFALSIPKGNELSLIDENIPEVKGDIQERLAISLYSLRLPNVKNKAVQGQKGGDNKTLNDFKGIEEVIARKEPTQAEKIESLVPLIDHLHTPHRPSYYPPNSLNLDILDTHISMLDKSLDYSHKLHITPPETSSQNAPPLPYLSSKHISPSKHAFTPEFAFNDLPMPNLIMELATRDIQFPNAKSLLQNSAAPSYIPSEVMISSVPIEDLNTSDITSQSKEILRDYDQKNIEDLGYLALKDEVEPIIINEKDVRTVNTSSRLTKGFLGEIPPPSHLNTVTYREQFDTEVHFAKNEDGNGYMFALKMKPKPSLETCDESKNIIFVIDGSSTIKKDRFETFKEGTLRSLKYLNPNDTFNILVADAKVIPLGKTSTRANGAGKAQAKQFLNERKYRGFFIDYDPFDLLENVTNYLDLEKDNVIVLLSDGHGFQNIKAHLEDFQELREASKGRYSIFAATASRGNNLSMLDVLTTFNKGELTYSKTHTAFPRSLAVMVRHINSLVAKDVQIHVTRARQDANLEFYPNNNTLPSLYSDRAYTIYGTIKEPQRLRYYPSRAHRRHLG